MLDTDGKVSKADLNWPVVSFKCQVNKLGQGQSLKTRGRQGFLPFKPPFLPSEERSVV